MESYVFVLGRQPEIGLAEARAVFGRAEMILENVARVESSSLPEIRVLGGVRKIGQVIWEGATAGATEFLVERLRGLPEGKITLGVSCYGRRATAGEARKLALYIKKGLGRSVRTLPNAGAEIADAASLGNRLGRSANRVELMMVNMGGGRVVVAELMGVQDLNDYTVRDRGRPRRDARVGMLPPKLAQVMINLAVGGRREGVVLDPFCGTGVVLQEAALMGFSIYGSDIEERMVEFTGANLEWLKGRYRMPELEWRVEAGDATKYRWARPVDFVVSEIYLGQAYAAPPPIEKLRENIGTCNVITEKFLRNLRGQLQSSARICVAMPVWFVGGRSWHLPVVRNLGDLGWRVEQAPMIYARAGQVVGRELIIACKS